MLDRDVWLMRRHENLLFQSYKKSLDFFAADGKEKIGRSQERPPLVTTLLKGFSLFRPWLKTYHTTLDQDGQSSHFTIEVAGDRWHRKVVVRDADEGFLWKKDFTKTGMITGFTLYTEDDNTLATLKKGTLASPSGEVWGRICGEDALELANDLKTGKMLRVKFMPKTPGLYLAIHPSVANRDDIKILLLSVAATLEAVNISYRV